MSGMDGPGPDERAQPSGRRTPDGKRVEDAGDDDGSGRRAVLSALVDNEPGVLAEVTGLFARRQVNIERLVGEPIGDGERSRITFVVAPPHPGVDQVTRQLEKLRPVVSVEERDPDVARRLTASEDEVEAPADDS
ncbi:MAG: acetolactate synthase small subunit [Haloferacaceae archaeon]